MRETTGLYLRGLGFVAAGALFWVMYFDLKDRLKPEPRRMLVFAFALGNASALLGLLAYRLAEALGAPEAPGPTSREILVYCVGLVGPIEEGAKFLVARAVIFRWRSFDEPIDGMVYATAVAIGFASLENLLYAPYLGWTEQLARALASPLTHSLFAAVWGFGVGHAFFRTRTRRSRFLWQAVPLVASMVLHGLYDYFLLALNATFAASGIALVLWLSLIGYARRLVRIREPVSDYD